MPNDLKSVKSIFDEAVEISAIEQRSAFLDKACGNDVQLRRQVEGLVDAHNQAGGFLQSSPFLMAAPRNLPPIDVVLGTMIGPYKLVEQIGEGGFGVVYLAEQTEPVRRDVALKVIKPGMDTKQVITRFEAERQALALMDHPNIARVLDAGATESGHPFFIMELIKGIPITEYCDQCSLTIHERLELFVSVCQAVQHAHQKGIIHRDVKPTNVLVTIVDGQPAPNEEIRRVIREEDPPCRSARLSTLRRHATTAAVHRRSDLRKLVQLVRRDLDWIVMKALEKDRSRRYETANGLARDIERFMNEQPVEACPPSATYQFHKFLRRNKLVIAVGTLVAVAMLLGLVGTSWQARRVGFDCFAQ